MIFNRFKIYNLLISLEKIIMENLNNCWGEFLLGEECFICSIAMSKLNSVKLECGHIFHNACINKVMYEMYKCPICKKKAYFNRKVAVYSKNNSNNFRPQQMIAVELGQMEPVLVHVFECEEYKKNCCPFFEDNQYSKITERMHAGKGIGAMYVPNVIFNRITLTGSDYMMIFRDHMKFYFGYGCTYLTTDINTRIMLYCNDFTSYEDKIFTSVDLAYPNHRERTHFRQLMRQMYKLNTYIKRCDLNLSVLIYFSAFFVLNDYFSVIP